MTRFWIRIPEWTWGPFSSIDEAKQNWPHINEKVNVFIERPDGRMSFITAYTWPNIGIRK